MSFARRRGITNYFQVNVTCRTHVNLFTVGDVLWLVSTEDTPGANFTVHTLENDIEIKTTVTSVRILPVYRKTTRPQPAQPRSQSSTTYPRHQRNRLANTDPGATGSARSLAFLTLKEKTQSIWLSTGTHNTYSIFMSTRFDKNVNNYQDPPQSLSPAASSYSGSPVKSPSKYNHNSPYKHFPSPKSSPSSVPFKSYASTGKIEYLAD